MHDGTERNPLWDAAFEQMCKALDIRVTPMRSAAEAAATGTSSLAADGAAVRHSVLDYRGAQR